MKVIDLYRKAQGDIWGRTELLSVDTCSKYIEDTLGLKEEYAVFICHFSDIKILILYRKV